MDLLDSDDLLLPGALDRLIAHWMSLQDQAGHVSVTGLDIDEGGNVIVTASAPMRSMRTGKK
jgi:hypothetical protein